MTTVTVLLNNFYTAKRSLIVCLITGSFCLHRKKLPIFLSVLFWWQCQSPGILGNWLMTSKAWNKYIFDGKTNHHHQLCRHVDPAKTGVNTSTTCIGIFKDFDCQHFKISVRLVCADKIIKNWCFSKLCNSKHAWY